MQVFQASLGSSALLMGTLWSELRRLECETKVQGIETEGIVKDDNLPSPQGIIGFHFSLKQVSLHATLHKTINDQNRGDQTRSEYLNSNPKPLLVAFLTPPNKLT